MQEIKNSNIVEVKNLTYHYGELAVLQHINFEIAEGEFIGIIGPNGAGKSTLLKLIAGLLTDKDHIFLGGIPLQNYTRKNLAKIIGYVPQETEFSFAYPVSEVILMGRYPYMKRFAYYSEKDKMIMKEAMRILDIERYENRNFQELSGGEKQRVVIAGALAQEARLIILDEPTSALDLHHQISIYRTLKNLQREKNTTILIVTHDINLAAQFCQRIILMADSKIIGDGKPEDVLRFRQLQEIFGVKVYIDINPMTNSLYVLPYDN
jgi:iron complex transport system ATP-binding protein